MSKTYNIIDCFEWAITEAMKRNLNSVYFWVNEDEYYPSRDWGMSAYHAVIKLGGKLYDISGGISIREVKKKYKFGNRLVRVNLSRILKEYC